MGVVNLQPEVTDERGLQNNQRSIERHLLFDHYIRTFTPGAMTLLTATTGLEPVANDWPWIIMADAVSSHAAVSWRKPSEWRAGLLRLRYWYTSDVGSTNNFRILLSVRAIRDSEVIAGTSLLFSAASVAGPAVAYTVKRSAYVYTTTALGSDDELLSARVVRLGGDAADTNVNDFHLLHLEVEHIPAIQAVT